MNCEKSGLPSFENEDKHYPLVNVILTTETPNSNES